MNVWLWPVLLMRSPVEFFQALRERWPWFPAYVMAVACNTIGSLLTMTAARGNIERAFQEAGVPALGSVLTGTALVVGSILGAVIVPLLVVFAYGFVTSFLGVVFHRYPDFGRVYALIMWCYLPSFTAGSLVRGVVVAIHPALFPDLSLSPAAFFSRDVIGNQLYRALATLDIFMVLFYVLFALGYAIITKLEVRKSAIVAGTLYGLQLLMVFAFSV